MGQDIFDRKTDQVVRIVDDVQLFCNKETHDRNFQKAAKYAGITGIKHEFDKYIIKTKCCRFVITYTDQRGSNLI